MLEAAIRDLESAQERFTFLETSMGTEAAIEALEQGERSVELRQEDYARALEEAVERVENSVP